jgi:cellulose synthase/poly-beta-1,6-N-acetylglucosamine synthase-like glycosyltransferase
MMRFRTVEESLNGDFPQDKSNSVHFSIGICASDDSSNLTSLIRTIKEERVPEEYILDRIIVIASGCTEDSLVQIRIEAVGDGRILLIEENERRGKAEAINKIEKNSTGRYLLFINADALPEHGSIAKLLVEISSDPRTGVLSACPVLEESRGGGTTSLVEELMWKIHNESSLLLNHMQVSNHSSDEMMIVRAEALQRLPLALVNDGAYIAGRAKIDGFLIKFCEEAKVKIEAPRRLIDLIEQRRRIIYGHLQVWHLTGESPKTVESLLLTSPEVSFRILIGVLSRNRRLVKVLPVAIASEFVSSLFALNDFLFSKNKHGVWKRYGN